MVRRVEKRKAPTSAHTSLAALAHQARHRWPGLLDAPPRCASTDALPCTCDACCRPYLTEKLEDCMSCVLTSPSCYGVGAGEQGW